MSTIKQFGLAGVGPNVQFGKGGNIVASATGQLSVYLSDGSTLANLNLADPTLATQAATKKYVDNAIQGLNVKDEVQAGTISPLPSNTYYNGPNNDGVGATLTATADGALVVDGYIVLANDRILVKNESSTTNNGIYYVTQTGDALTPYILTRTLDADTGPNLSHAFVLVTGGNTLFGTSWTMNVIGPIVIGFTGITWAQFATAGSYTAGNGLTLSGTQFNVNVDGTTTYIDGSNNVAVKSSATSGQVLLSQGSGSAAWGAVNLGSSDAVTGTLLVGNGGTGLNSVAANNILYTSASNTFSASSITSLALSLLADSSTSSMQSTLGLVIGTNVEAWSANLDSFAALSGTGVVVQTAANTFTERQVVADSSAGYQGLRVTNPAGVAGDITLGLNIDGLTLSASPADAWEVAVYDGTNNKKTTMSDIKSYIGASITPDPLFSYGSITTTTANVGASLPTHARVIRVAVKITVPYTIGANIAVLDSYSNVLAANADIDAQNVGLYIIDLIGTDFMSDGQATATVTGSPSAGAATISMDYRIIA